jgi:hypothetical protein
MLYNLITLPADSMSNVIEKHDGMPAIFFTLPADSISKDLEKHDGMPANFVERNT